MGIGPGNKDYILPIAVKILNKCKIIIGFSRAMQSIDYICGKKIIINSLENIINILDEYKEIDIAVIASGDPTFYGINNYLKNKYLGEIKIIPGISSFQYLTSKINMSWNNAFLGSLHGREESFIENIKSHKISIWLTDRKNNPSKLCSEIEKESIKCKVIVGENLSYEDEVITEGPAVKFIGNEYSDLSILIVENI